MARLLSPLRLAAAGVVLLAVVLVVLVTRGSNQYLEVPDEAHPLKKTASCNSTLRHSHS